MEKYRFEIKMGEEKEVEVEAVPTFCYDLLKEYCEQEMQI